MKNSISQEIFVSVVLIVLLVFCLNPFHFWMPDTLIMMMVVGLVLVFAIFAGLIWREHARDEREMLHRMLAARSAYLAGVGILVVGVIVQMLEHKLDSWLIITLGVMVLAKIIGVIYSRAKH